MVQASGSRLSCSAEEQQCGRLVSLNDRRELGFALLFISISRDNAAKPHFFNTVLIALSFHKLDRDQNPVARLLLRRRQLTAATPRSYTRSYFKG
ncbi:hypothetical protein AAC387_Pa07g1327 [Persea americana]